MKHAHLVCTLCSFFSLVRSLWGFFAENFVMSCCYKIMPLRAFRRDQIVSTCSDHGQSEFFQEWVKNSCFLATFCFVCCFFILFSSHSAHFIMGEVAQQAWNSIAETKLVEEPTKTGKTILKNSLADTIELARKIRGQPPSPDSVVPPNPNGIWIFIYSFFSSFSFIYAENNTE